MQDSEDRVTINKRGTILLIIFFMFIILLGIYLFYKPSHQIDMNAIQPLHSHTVQELNDNPKPTKNQVYSLETESSDPKQTLQSIVLPELKQNGHYKVEVTITENNNQ